jgi:hypothetical protein
VTTYAATALLRPAEHLDPADVVTACKQLSYVELDVRHIKADHLAPRPIHHPWKTGSNGLLAHLATLTRNRIHVAGTEFDQLTRNPRGSLTQDHVTSG